MLLVQCGVFVLHENMEKGHELVTFLYDQYPKLWPETTTISSSLSLQPPSPWAGVNWQLLPQWGSLLLSGLKFDVARMSLYGIVFIPSGQSFKALV